VKRYRRCVREVVSVARTIGTKPADHRPGYGNRPRRRQRTGSPGDPDADAFRLRVLPVAIGLAHNHEVVLAERAGDHTSLDVILNPATGPYTVPCLLTCPERGAMGFELLRGRRHSAAGR
jgi:hypothetical protein